MIPIIIQHNISAINSFRNTNKNKKALNKNLERLSSGYKINRAGDDAAGLAISEGMRAKIKGIDQAERNILDGVGLIHTAEGAMQEIHSMLQRAYELGMASSNGTYSDSDRECMQEEVEALLTELDRIAAHTEFNGIPVLQGFRVLKTTHTYTASGVPGTYDFPSWLKNDDRSFTAGRLNGTYKTKETYQDGNKYDIVHASATLDFSAIDTGANISDLVGTGFRTTCFTCPRYYGVQFVDDGSGSRVVESGGDYTYMVDIKGLTKAEEVTKAIVDATQNGRPNNHYTVFKADGAKLIVYDTRSIEDPPAGATNHNGWQNWALADFNVNFTTNPRGGKFEPISTKFTPTPGASPTTYTYTQEIYGGIYLQIGANASECLDIDLPSIDVWEMGLQEINVSNQERAVISVDTLKRTIDFISKERGRMGAYEGRLEHAYNSQAVTKENLTAAESRIRDTDMADEITSHTKNNILLQAAQAMLAQANAIPQNILNLLQS